MSELPRGAHVEIVGDSRGCPVHPVRVLINGVDVGLIAEGGLSLDGLDGANDALVSVTLTLYPKRVTIRPGDQETR